VGILICTDPHCVKLDLDPAHNSHGGPWTLAMEPWYVDGLKTSGGADSDPFNEEQELDPDPH
jgi:hypothetical protein